MQNELVKYTVAQKIAFHNYWTNKIKRDTKATYVSHLKNPKGYFLKVNLDGEELLFEVGGTPDDIKTENYVEMLNDIKSYADGKRG